ncbi:TonB-dependent receptor [Emcibacter sp. SYSU 3D8]|uniref:TonB-dependent receptor n=1 Tax=Emcibacter sp. SYSU 3D8 TaxID=3133969 RepID=UPI0031FE5CD3
MTIKGLRLTTGQWAAMGVAALWMWHPAGAAAQDAPPRPAAEAVRPHFDTVVVSARKREETVQDVPVAITAVSKAELERYAIADLNQVSTITPNLTISPSSSGAGALLYIRGIGTSSVDAGFDQSVGLVIDDVFYNRGQWIAQGFMDMQQVEVLKGPQTLYFGKNTPAGLVSIRTADPTGEFEGYVRAGYEVEAREKMGEFAFSVPVSDTFGLRVAFRATDSSGWMRNIAQPHTGIDPLGFTLPGASDYRVNGKEEYLGRVTAKWTPNDDLTMTLKVQGASMDNDGYSGVVQKFGCQGPNNTPQPIFGVPDLDGECNVDFRQSRGMAPPELGANFPEMKDGSTYGDYKSLAISFKAEYDLEDINVTSVTGYHSLRSKLFDNYDFSNASQVFAHEDTKFNAFSQEIRALSSFDFPLNFMVGAYYQDTNLTFRNTSRVAALPADAATGRYFSWDRTSMQDGRTWSLFGEAIWNIVDTLELSGGLRYTKERKVSHLQNTYVHALLNGVFSSDPFDSTISNDNLSPQVTLSWHATDELMLYGAYKQGFKSGGFSHSTAPRRSTLPMVDQIALLEFGPEKVKGFELGAKASLLGDTLRANLVFYRYQYSDLQVNIFDSSIAAFHVANAAAARTTGVEFDVDFAATDELTLRGSVAYNDAKYTDYVGGCWAGQTPAQGCNLQPNGAGVFQTQNLSGTRLQLAPEWALTAGFSYSLPISNGLALDWNVDGRYSSAYPLYPQQRPDAVQGGFFTIDAGLTLHSDDDRWAVSFIGRNLTNEVVLLSAVDSPLTGSGTGTPNGKWADLAGTTQRGRTLMFQVTYRFQ